MYLAGAGRCCTGYGYGYGCCCTGYGYGCCCCGYHSPEGGGVGVPIYVNLILLVGVSCCAVSYRLLRTVLYCRVPEGEPGHMPFKTPACPEAATITPTYLR